VGDVLLLTNIPRPYREPLFSVMSECLTASGHHLVVGYYSNLALHERRSGEPVDRSKSCYDSVRATGIDIVFGSKVLSIPTRAVWLVASRRWAAVVVGGYSPTALASALVARMRRTPYLVWSGTTIGFEPRLGWVKRRLRRFIVRGASGCVGYGTAAQDYLIEMGGTPDRTFAATNCVDPATFALQRPNAVDGLDRGTPTEILVVGRLVRDKGVELVIEAARPLVGRPFVLNIVGDGPDRARLEELAAQAGLGRHVTFSGTVPAAKMPSVYSSADALVFPTLRDCWGLVLNEAMHCGLPVIASPFAGATRDLVRDGVDGWVVDPRDTKLMSQALSRLIDDPGLRTRMGVSALDRVREIAGVDRSAASFVEAIVSVTGGDRP